MSNFLFLKKNDEKLFKIIAEAESLFRDEYFEQSVVQVRRYAENLCKNILQEKVRPEDTFDSMICKIKDNSFGNTRMKEFSDDLYFLKKHGNNSAHSASAGKKEQLGKIALECLERAYEIAIFYSNVRYGYDKKLDKTVFSEEMLMTGKKTGKKSSPKKLTEKYSVTLEKTRAKSTAKVSTAKPARKSVQKPLGKSKSRSKKKNKGNKKFLLTVLVAVLIAMLYFIFYYPI